MSGIRKLFIGLDGTWNDPGQEEHETPSPTNVVKFQEALKYCDGQQIQYYEEGVGTRDWESLPGGVRGIGLDKRVLGSYRFLSKRFNDSDYTREQNQVFIFGFSRGSYTARRLAGLINFCGIPVDPNDDEKALDIYKEQDSDSAEELKSGGSFFDISVEVVGVWDTVKATGDPDIHDTLLPANVKKGYHAMAIDEERRSFPILKWEADPRVVQVWFAGVHSDVGGGYAACTLSDLPLRWMINRFLYHDVDFKANYVGDSIHPNPLGEAHESCTGFWLALGKSPRPVESGDFIHEGVAERMKDGYKPQNVPSDVIVWKES